MTIKIGVLDRSRGDGAISREEWKRVAAANSAVFLKVIRGNPGPPPDCESAGWYYGLHKLIRCADERSAVLYKEAVSLVGEVWEGARLEAVDKADLPLRPRARVWLPAEPSSAGEIEDIIKYCNPSLPAHDWKVIRLEKTEEPYRQALILLNAESIGPLNELKGAISYGFEKVTLRVLSTEAKTDCLQPATLQTEADGQMTMEVDQVPSDAASIGGGSSIDESAFGLDKLFVEEQEEGNPSAELALLEESL
ncbi:uncharacterized protein LOC128921998 [Zeugodacus cucurbitae]|uniref:uncharacterized protein LOC128921998 n=1 Tax=Zeugodacus cucurbitae TaxID=28588 RepID=UPI0023D923DC|nr:uncharacterized protein LOC128921998 [Zeugodacus cucurbitae]